MSVTVYRSNTIITLDPACPTATAIAVRDGRILHVGDARDVLDLVREIPHVINDDYLDDVIVPGFIEAHGHLFGDGALCHYAWLGFDDRRRADGRTAQGCQYVSEVIDRLREEVSQHEGDDPVFGFGFDPVFHDGRTLTRHDLDAVSADVPVLVMNASGHIAYANSAHLARQDITSATTDPGVIKDASGEPVGEFHETALALVLANTKILGQNAERAVRDGASLARQAGCTTASDLALFAAGPAFETYRNVANGEDFPVRVVYSPHIGDMSRVFSSDDLLAHVTRLREESTDRFFCGPLKWTADGSIQGFTAALRWPGYCGDSDHAYLILDADTLIEQVTPYHRAGFQAAIHTNGDEATEQALRAIEHILTEHARPDHRHRLEHCQMASRSMFDKMARLGVGANLFANHIYYWGDIHRTRTMGADRARRMDAAATALAAGVVISLHSDHPVTPVDPLFSMWCAVNRVTRSGHVLGPHDRITAAEALQAVTLGSAYLIHRDDELGSLEVGKWADFTVLGDNPLTVDPMTLKDIPVRGTVVAGRRTSE